MSKFLDTGNDEYPATWLGLRRVLKDSKHGTLALKIKNAMQFVPLFLGITFNCS